MPLPVQLPFGNNNRAPSYANNEDNTKSYSLTMLGKEKVRDLPPYTNEFNVLSVISEMGSATPVEISNDVHISTVKVNYVLRQMYKLGYIKEGA